MNSEISFRYATEDDVPELLRLICELAEHQKAGEHVVATPELLRRWMFEEGAAEGLVVEHEHDGLVGFAIFYPTFSTWVGKCGLYLEDLYIEERHRGSGTGRALMAELSRICEERDWVRFDWTCLDWNTGSLGFYKNIGAEILGEWVHHRLSGEALEALAQESAGEMIGKAPSAKDSDVKHVMSQQSILRESVIKEPAIPSNSMTEILN